MQINLGKLLEEFPWIAQTTLHIVEDSGYSDNVFLVIAGGSHGGGTPILVFDAGYEGDAEEAAAEYCSEQGWKGLCSDNPDDVGLDAEELEEAEKNETMPEGWGFTGNGEWYEYAEFYTVDAKPWVSK